MRWREEGEKGQRGGKMVWTREGGKLRRKKDEGREKKWRELKKWDEVLKAVEKQWEETVSRAWTGKKEAGERRGRGAEVGLCCHPVVRTCYCSRVTVVKYNDSTCVWILKSIKSLATPDVCVFLEGTPCRMCVSVCDRVDKESRSLFES